MEARNTRIKCVQLWCPVGEHVRIIYPDKEQVYTGR
jgi:hypothetical protein